jgi:hypothetical protein
MHFNDYICLFNDKLFTFNTAKPITLSSWIQTT